MAAGDEGIGVNRKFHRGLGGVALEVFSVVLGVLVALGVDGWSAERAIQGRADQAQTAIMAEVRANKSELDSTLVTLEAAVGGPMLAGQSSLRSMNSGGKALDLAGPQEGSVELILPEFSRAAWQTSQMTDATTRLDFDWLIKVAQAYETQALYSQLSVDVVRTMGDLGSPDQKAVVGRLNGQLRVLLDVHRSLTATYDEILEGEGS